MSLDIVTHRYSGFHGSSYARGSIVFWYSKTFLQAVYSSNHMNKFDNEVDIRIESIVREPKISMGPFPFLLPPAIMDRNPQNVEAMLNELIPVIVMAIDGR